MKLIVYVYRKVSNGFFFSTILMRKIFNYNIIFKVQFFKENLEFIFLQTAILICHSLQLFTVVISIIRGL